MPILELDSVSKIYDGGENQVIALANVCLRLERGEFWLIVGPSGSGKTTLLSVMGCILQPTSGRVIVADIDATGLGENRLPGVRARYFGYIFQHYHLFNALTALENVEMALLMKFGSYRRSQEEAARLLTQVGLAKRMHHKPARLSGGERQRVAIARALAGNPPLVLGDEPTAALDTDNALAVVELLRRLAHEENRTVVIVSHDHRLESYADRTVRVQDGRITSMHQRADLESEKKHENA